MSDDKAPGQPQIIVQTSPFGQPEPVEIDSNRLNPIKEARFGWLESLAIPVNPEDIHLQALTYLLGSAFTVSILRELLPRVPELWVVVVMLIGLGVWCGWYAWSKFSELRTLLFYRLFWLATGVLLAFWHDLLTLINA